MPKIDIEELKPLIIERLKPLNPDKIILFGSYAYGTPTDDSDIDLFIEKNSPVNNIDALALLKLRDLMKKYKIGFDILSATKQEILGREDSFYKTDILQKGIKLYG
ncbi:nucleotidyltransferase domain-containing protein [Arcobacter sp. FWKO B]|uniref:nucleotidyltransferase domain-containing protein n=1 Tax=Arcobacter sp. FWKO B TaxID=2593672 RepID=UPI0018A6568E|nr:nucleotidyltransferase domain-containing protein [Arcobacter sp. FWKO B]QOG11970.1 nucleotidyltransferase domain-containing protein [Arcobacter sp. FWKO B]